MPERPGEQTVRDMDRTRKEMEHELEEVSEHLEEAKAKAPDARIDEGGPLGDVTGTVDQEGGPMFGEDPAGAGKDRPDDEG